MALVRQIDTVTVLYCFRDEAAHKEVKVAYESNFESNGYDPSKISFTGIQHDAGKPLHDTIADYVNNESSADFVVVAPDPMLTRTEISVSEHLVKLCKKR